MNDRFTRDCQADILKHSLNFRPYRQELLPFPAEEWIPVTWFLVAWCHPSQSQWQKFSQSLKYVRLPGRSLGELSFGWEHEKFWHHNSAFLVIFMSEEQLQPAVVNLSLVTALSIKDFSWVHISGCPAFCQAQSCNFFCQYWTSAAAFHLPARPNDLSTSLSSPLPPSLLPNPCP